MVTDNGMLTIWLRLPVMQKTSSIIQANNWWPIMRIFSKGRMIFVKRVYSAGVGLPNKIIILVETVWPRNLPWRALKHTNVGVTGLHLPLTYKMRLVFLRSIILLSEIRVMLVARPQWWWLVISTVTGGRTREDLIIWISCMIKNMHQALMMDCNRVPVPISPNIFMEIQTIILKLLVSARGSSAVH